MKLQKNGITLMAILIGISSCSPGYKFPVASCVQGDLYTFRVLHAVTGALAVDRYGLEIIAPKESSMLGTKLEERFVIAERAYKSVRCPE